MKLHLVLTILISLCLFTTQTLARFLTNISSIPPSLSSNATAWSTFLKFSGCHLGQKVHGLHILKNYFHHFGYIPNDLLHPYNISDDDFDDALQSAVKTYQKNFNLNITGQLDKTTLQQITRSRCGNADIVNGTTTMNSGKSPTGNKSPHFHSVGHYTFFSGTPRWPENRRNLTYAFHQSNTLSDTVKNIFARAFNRWAMVIPMTFTETHDYAGGADIRVGFFAGDHGDNEPFDGLLGTLAHAFAPTSGRLHLDNEENWIVEGKAEDASLSSAIDLESVVVHEIGHLLGLGHSSVEDAVMCPTMPSRTRKIELHTDDIEGVQFLYGSNPDYDGSTAETMVNGASGSGFRLGFGALLVAGYALLIL